MNTWRGGIHKRTLQPDVHNICPVRGASRRLWRALELGDVNAPLRAEGDVHLAFLYDRENRLCRGRQVGIRSGFGRQETAGEMSMSALRLTSARTILFVTARTRLLERNI